MTSLRAFFIVGVAGMTIGAAATGVASLTPLLTATPAPHCTTHGSGSRPSCAPTAATATPATPTTSPRSSADASSAAGGEDQHGDDVSKAARSCPRGKGGVHGKCVSAVAHKGKHSGTETPDTPEAPEPAESASD